MTRCLRRPTREATREEWEKKYGPLGQRRGVLLMTTMCEGRLNEHGYCNECGQPRGKRGDKRG